MVTKTMTDKAASINIMVMKRLARNLVTVPSFQFADARRVEAHSHLPGAGLIG
jgi:hypothetical protein